MIKKFLKSVLFLLSRFIYWIVPQEFKDVSGKPTILINNKEITIDSIIKENSTKENYEHFKEIFKTTVLFRDVWEIRKYAIQNAISNDKQKFFII